MALSNKFGSLLLTTGNKSEMSVGYCTLYGDMNGGLAVIADLPKMMVYRVARWRNRRRPDIPEAILTKPPRPSSAPTRPTRTASRLTSCSTRSWSCTSSNASRRRKSSPRASTNPPCAAS